MDPYKALDVLRTEPTIRVSIAEVDGEASMINWLGENAWIADWLVIMLVVGVTVGMCVYVLHLLNSAKCGKIANGR
ncbi:hypothetical protein CCP1ISM_2200001 [Azospirillaceae bacterium]